MAFNFLRLFKKRCSSTPASTPDVSVSKVVSPVPGEVRFPFLCYYYAETYADYLNVRSKSELFLSGPKVGSSGSDRGL